MSLTNDPNDPGLREHRPDGQQVKYLVLLDEERAKGFVRPLRTKYTHKACGSLTSMGYELSATYARDPHFYGGTFCCACGMHFHLRSVNPVTGSVEWNFFWEDGEPVGSDAEEAAEYKETTR